MNGSGSSIDPSPRRSERLKGKASLFDKDIDLVLRRQQASDILEDVIEEMEDEVQFKDFFWNHPPIERVVVQGVDNMALVTCLKYKKFSDSGKVDVDD